MPHFRRPRWLVVAVLAALLVTPLAAQVALADPPPTSGVTAHFGDYAGFSYVDEDLGLIALGGPPPEEGCIGLGFDDPALITLVFTPSGALKLQIRQGPTPVFVYDLTLGDPCEIVFGGGVPEPMYVGWMSTVANNNDIIPTFTKMNSFGISSHGWVFDMDENACHFNAHERVHLTLEGGFMPITSDINIVC